MEYSNSLEYQKEVTDIIDDIFDVDDLINNSNEYNSNPILNLNENTITKLKQKIAKHNNKLEKNLHQQPFIEDCLNIDVKMETGTGKTYVYVKTIFELNKNYGINKFIILVPSLAIKLGTQNFINDSIFHFKKEYGKFIYLKVQNNNVEKNASKKIPTAVKEFVKTSKYTDDYINVLLLNDDYLKETSYGKKREELFLDEYTTPADAIASTSPFLIIDEPHRFDEKNKAMKFIKKFIKPQCIIRFGATFPEKDDKKDYKNLIYDLNSRKAINDGLIKGVNVYIEGKRDIENRDCYIDNIKQGEQITIHYKNDKEKDYIKKEVKKGRVLNFLGKDFTGIKLQDITKDEAILSNGWVISKGKKDNFEKESNHFNSYDFSKETQEAMIKLALEKHFEKEKENFMRDDIIKTICLFFIEDISSYRDRGKEQWVKNIFEELLKTKLDEEIAKINGGSEKEILYKNYLQATAENLNINEKQKLVHGGYFSDDDKKDSEESEYRKILVDKEGTLNIYNKDGSFNTFRFIFSKWTLKEGWDNPNVFTIAKLRGSGSEISKLQEVGRGLRLPVDINMNRKKPNEEDFYLTYIVNHNEKDFALKLIAEICTEEITKINGEEYLSVEQISNIAVGIGIAYDELFIKLITDKIIEAKSFNNCYKIIDIDTFTIEYSKYLTNEPVSRKITFGKNNEEDGRTKIRKSNFDKIKELWSILNQNFIIVYNENAFKDESMEQVVYEALLNIKQEEKSEIRYNVIETKNIINSEEKKVEEADYKYIDVSIKSHHMMQYSDFIKEISKNTNIPLNVIHTAITKFVKEKYKNDKYDNLFNKEVCKKLVSEIIVKKHNKIKGLFEYQSVNISKKSTKLTDENGNMLNSVCSNDLGRKEFRGKATINENYLYDKVMYDSDKELDNIREMYGDKVEVYGKIPKNSIRIPKIDGATCSPDFMYVVKDKKGNAKKMNIIIETKNYESFDQDARGTEKETREYMKKYFETLEEKMKQQNIDLKFEYQLAKDEVISIIEKLIEKEKNDVGSAE